MANQPKLVALGSEPMAALAHIPASPIDGEGCRSWQVEPKNGQLDVDHRISNSVWVVIFGQKIAS